MALNAKQTILLRLTAQFGDLAAVDFQKLLFLHCQNTEETPSYEFIPYKFGGFSFSSFADKRKLIEKGLLVDDDRRWQLTPAGEGELADAGPPPRAIRPFAEQFSKLRGEALVAHAYREHPYYATRSEIAERVLHSDDKALAAIDAAKPLKGPPGLCSIGYEGRSLEGYLNELLRDGVTLLCDVRRNPISRKYGFSRGTLSKGCDGVGIRYEHLPQLGIASDERRELNTQADYDRLFAKYERDDLPLQTAALTTIADWIRQGARVALTCYERSPAQCHRHCVADALAAGGKFAMEVKHL